MARSIPASVLYGMVLVLALLGLAAQTALADVAGEQSDAVEASHGGTLVLNPLPSRVNSGDTVIFSGRLVTADGFPAANKLIYIKDDVDFDVDTIIKSTYTDRNGEFEAGWTARVRSSGSWDFYAVHEGSTEVGHSRSTTYSVRVLTYQSSITLNPPPSTAFVGDTVTLSGRLAIESQDPGSRTIIIKDDVDLDTDDTIGSVITDARGNFELDWTARVRSSGAWDFYAVYEGGSGTTSARSQTHSIDVKKYGGSITLDSIPYSAKQGSVITFTGTLVLEGNDPDLHVVYIKDEDLLNPDDLLATAIVDRDGRFSVDWVVKDVDPDSVIDIYAVFEGTDSLKRLATCNVGCTNTSKLLVFGSADIPPPPRTTDEGAFMELYYSLDLQDSPHVLISPSPDSYDTTKRYIAHAQEGIRMWTYYLEQRFGGNWNVTFEVLDPATPIVQRQPDILMNLVTYEDDNNCYDDYAGLAYIMTRNPVNTIVCVPYDVSRLAAHEFIHAMGLGHTFNTGADLMCSTENGKPTCSSSSFIRSTPSILNLEATKAIYGADGFVNPNNDIRYDTIFHSKRVSDVPPTLVSATYDRSTGILTLTFSEVIDKSATALAGLYIHESGQTDGGVNPGDSVIHSAADTATLTLTLSDSTRREVNLMAAPHLIISAGTVRDLDGNMIAAVRNQPITVIGDDDGNDGELRGMIEGLRSDVAALSSRITNLDVTITNLTARVTALESGGGTPPPTPMTGVKGKIFTDTNNNNRLDPGELGRAGIEVITVSLTNHSDVQRIRTDANGDYTFELDAGGYLVQAIGGGPNSYAYITIPSNTMLVQNLAY